MKKVGILTINDIHNYGNRLQNYATQEFLKENGFIAETIKNVENKKNVKLKRLIKFFIQHKKYQKESIFLKFDKENINFSKFKVSPEKVSKDLNDKYDFFVTGSDQVWNPTFKRMSDIDFLTFSDNEKRISFVASFGINEIPDNLKKYYKENLKDFKSLSVREERGKEIIKELTDRTDAVVLLDPTMLIPIEKWECIMKKPKMMDRLNGRKYILNYFLGNLSESRRKEIERVAKENDCEIINILDEKSPFYLCGPSEFVYLEKNTFLVCTDSFHSTVFAILFNRPFVVFNREDSEVKMNSRLDTLLSKFEIENRWYKEKINKDLLTADFNVNRVLEEEREKARTFIGKSMK